MLGWFRKQKRETASEQVDAIMIHMLIGDDQSLFIMLAADGGINRLGTGSVENSERDMFIARIDPSLFQTLRRQITPELLAWCGQSRADPNPQGLACKLIVGFRTSRGEELVTEWKYGSDSMGPPAEIALFVEAAVTVTEPWFREQIATRAQL